MAFDLDPDEIKRLIWDKQKQYIRMRIKGHRSDYIAKSIDVSEKTLREWDKKIQTDPEMIRKCISYVLESSNMIDYVMDMEDFKEIWGPKPKP